MYERQDVLIINPDLRDIGIVMSGQVYLVSKGKKMRNRFRGAGFSWTSPVEGDWWGRQLVLANGFVIWTRHLSWAGEFAFKRDCNIWLGDDVAVLRATLDGEEVVVELKTWSEDRGCDYYTLEILEPEMQRMDDSPQQLSQSDLHRFSQLPEYDFSLATQTSSCDCHGH